MPRFFRPTLTVLLVAALATCAFAECNDDEMLQGNLVQPTDPMDPRARGVATDAAATSEEKPKLSAVLVENDLEYATLLAAVQAAESGKVLADLEGAGPFTVFAPNNEAFKAFFAASENPENQPAELLASPELGDILRRHVIAGKVTAADALAMDLPVEVPTLDGENSIKIDKTVEGDLLVGGVKVVSPDIEAANGIIHGMEGVIVDFVPTADAAEEIPEEGEEMPEEGEEMSEPAMPEGEEEPQP